MRENSSVRIFTLGSEKFQSKNKNKLRVNKFAHQQDHEMDLLKIQKEGNLIISITGFS